MRFDVYTKVVLTVIAVLLALNVTKTFIAPAPVEAQPAVVRFGALEMAFGGTGLWFFNKRTGAIWGYDLRNHQYQKFGTLVELGKPLQ